MISLELVSTSGIVLNETYRSFSDLSYSPVLGNLLFND